VTRNKRADRPVPLSRPFAADEESLLFALQVDIPMMALAIFGARLVQASFADSPCGDNLARARGAFGAAFADRDRRSSGRRIERGYAQSPQPGPILAGFADAACIVETGAKNGFGRNA